MEQQYAGREHRVPPTVVAPHKTAAWPPPCDVHRGGSLPRTAHFLHPLPSLFVAAQRVIGSPPCRAHGGPESLVYAQS
jgi:hypothetical protein